MTEAADSIRALFPEQYLRKFLEEGIRPDARHFSAPRQTSFKRGVIQTADGSATVKLGQTSVVAGVTLSPFRPTVGTSSMGRLEVVVELGAVCSSRFPIWKPSDQASTVSQFVGRTLRSAGVLDLSDLIIKDGAAAYVANVSVTCLNYDGNVEDAALLAALLAIIDTRLPAVQVNDTGEVVECEGEYKRLKIRNLPVGLTQVLLDCGNDKVETLVDPTADEEDQADCSVTVVLAVPLPLASQPAAAAHSAPVQLHKPGGAAVIPAQLRALVSTARQRAAIMLPLLLKELQ